MVEAVRARKGDTVTFIERGALSGLVDYVLPIAMAVLVVVAVSATLSRGGALRTWSDDYDGAGTFLVESCQPSPDFSGGQWTCAGRLTSAGATQEIRTTLLTSMDARVSQRPYVGQQMDIFHQVGDRSQVYPLAYRLNEMTRVYLTLIPRLLLLVGAVMWLVGWMLTRNTDRDDLVARDAMRLPQRFGWQSRALNWFIGAGVIWVLNHLLTTRLIGSLDIL